MIAGQIVLYLGLAILVAAMLWNHWKAAHEHWKPEHGENDDPA
jgi:hypothetical protein